MDRSADRWNEISPLLRFLIVLGVVETLATILYFGITLWYLARHKKPIDDESQPHTSTKGIRGARGIVVTMNKMKEQAPLARIVLAPERRGGPREEAWTDQPSVNTLRYSSYPIVCRSRGKSQQILALNDGTSIVRSVLTAGGTTTVGTRRMDGTLPKGGLSSLHWQAY